MSSQSMTQQDPGEGSSPALGNHLESIQEQERARAAPSGRIEGSMAVDAGSDTERERESLGAPEQSMVGGDFGQFGTVPC